MNARQRRKQRRAGTRSVMMSDPIGSVIALAQQIRRDIGTPRSGYMIPRRLAEALGYSTEELHDLGVTVMPQ